MVDCLRIKMRGRLFSIMADLIQCGCTIMDASKHLRLNFASKCVFFALIAEYLTDQLAVAMKNAELDTF